MKRIMIVVGTRPEAIKMAPLHIALRLRKDLHVQLSTCPSGLSQSPGIRAVNVEFPPSSSMESRARAVLSRKSRAKRIRTPRSGRGSWERFHQPGSTHLRSRPRNPRTRAWGGETDRGGDDAAIRGVSWIQHWTWHTMGLITHPCCGAREE